MNGVTFAVAAMVGTAVFLVLVGLGRLIQRRTEPLQTRLDTLLPQTEPIPLPGEDRKPEKPQHPIARVLNRLLSTQRFSVAISSDLARADLPLTVPEYILFHVGIASVGFLLASWALGSGAMGIAGGLGGLMLPGFYLRRRQSQREVAFQTQLPDTLTLIVGSLRSGYGLTMALDAVSKQMPQPSAAEFGRVVREIGLSVPIASALSNLVRRIRSDDLDLVVTAIAIQYEMGGNLANVLDSITGTIRERIRLQQQVRVLTAQQRLTRLILTFLPFILGIVLYIMNPTYMLALFTPGPTLLIPITAVMLIVLGHLVMSRLSQIQV